MLVPKFLKDNDTIGITASSAGILDKIDKYEDSINNVKKNVLCFIDFICSYTFVECVLCY